MTALPTGSRILVTGGAGFIGSHLTERLLREGYSVVVMDDCSTGSLENLRHVASNPRLEVLQTTISGAEELPRIVRNVSAIFHLAAAVGVDLVMKSPIRTIQTNLQETEVLLEAASAAQVPTVIASTSEVYGKSQKEGFSETDDLLIGPPYLGRWSYACSKLMDEFLAFAHAQEKGLPITVVRFFNTVGPRQTGRYGMVLPRFIAAAREDAPLQVFGNGQQTRCFCFVLDAVEALLRLIQTPAAKGQIVNIGGTEEVTIVRLAEEVIRLLQSKSSIQSIPYDQAYAPGFEDMLRRKPVVEKLQRLTGFRPETTLEQIILKTAE